MWFDQEGIRIAEGRTTNISGCTVIPWVKAGAQVYQLLKEGTFATQDKIDAAQDNEYRELAKDLWQLRHDLSDEAEKQGFLPKISELYGNFPESTEKIKELLKTLEGRAVFVKELSDFMVAYDNNRELLRFQFQHTPKALISCLEKLNLVPEQFKAIDNFVPAMGKFITQDEIDHMLTRSSGVSEMEIGIYSYFMQEHNAKERAMFLREQYGTGGISYTGYDEWHDSKGMKLSRTDDFSGRENYDTVHLTWNQVQKRIEELINEGHYLTLDEEAYLPDYEKRVLAQELKSFFDHDPNAPTEEQNRDDLLPYLPEPSEINELQEEMVKILAAVSPDYPHFNTMQKALEDINAYADGTYSLFNPLPGKSLQAERHGKQAVKNPQQRRFKTREKSDGQIAIDFSAMRVAEPQPLNETEPVQEQPQNLSHIKQETTPAQEVQSAAELQEQESPSTEPFTDLQKKAAEIAGRYEKLPLQDKIAIIAQSFGNTTGKIETSPCTGKWRGTSDISIRFDNGVSLFIGNALTPKAKTAKVQNECVNRAFVQYNPEIISITKEAAAAVLMKREAKDNKIAAQKGLKPYTLLNVEFNDGADEKSSGHIGWYYVTLGIDGKICTHIETGLNHDIADGKVSETPTRANYFAAGALEETDVDYIFNNVGFSSASSLYSLPIRDDVRERAEKTLAVRGATTPSQEQANSAPTIGGLNPKSPADLYHEFLPKIQQYFEASPEYTHYRKLDRSTGIEEIKKQIDLLVSEMGNLDGDFREAYSKYPLFSDWMATDIYTRITRHFSETRENDPDLVTLHAFDSNVLDWVNTGTKEPPETSFVELYRNVLIFLVNEIRSSNLYSYLQDKNTPYDEALDEIDSEIAFHMGNLAETNPALYHAYTSLPMFRDWLIEDALALNYHEPIKDNRDAIDRYANEPNMPQWLQKTGIILNIEKNILNVSEEKYVDNISDYQASIEIYSNEPDSPEWVHNNEPVPIFREESVPYVRKYVELEHTNHSDPIVNLEDGITSADTKRSAKQVHLETTEYNAPESPQDIVLSNEFVEIDGGTVSPYPDLVENQNDGLRSIVIDLTAKPDQPKVERHNYHIIDDNLSVGGQKTKYQNNVAAIRTLKQIEAEGRLALPEEQDTLSKYVGWGGLAEAFDSDNEKWVKEYTELKELLTPGEYESAQSTVLNAHYTSPTVIKAIYEGVNRMGFTPGNILEPSCGIGNFFGLLPEKLSDSKLYGVELDSITGRITKQLYQQAEITIDGFEKTDYPDNFFDLAVGNVPFGNYGVYDKRYNKENFLIHDYFITKSLDKVRPGGIVAFITTKGTMDKADTKARESIAQKADLLGAIRLPNNAFQANARTNVTTDILFLQKRGSVPEKMPDWVHIGQTEDGVPLNNYFLQQPEMVLGKMEHWKNMYGNEAETACIPIDGADLSAQLSEAVTHITPPNQGLLRNAPIQENEANISYIPAAPDVRNFSYTLSNGQLYFRENSHMRLEKLAKQPTDRIKGMIKIRDSARKLIDLQLDNAGETEIRAEQAKLNTLYDRFTKEFGLINDKANRLAFEEDSSYPLLCSLEVLDEDKKLERKADIFTKRTIQHNTPVTSVDTSVEALGVSIGERACVDLGYMASLMGGSEKIPQIVNDLKGVIFKDPSTGYFDFEEGGTNWSKGWLTEDAYLSGNVHQKLEEARAAAESNPEFAVNVAALEKVQPKDLSASEISVRIGAPWVDIKYYKQFMYELLQTPEYLQNRDIDLLYSEVTCEWYVKGKKRDSETNSCVWNTYGTKRINAYEIFEASLNQHQVQVYDNIKSDEKGDRVLNVKDTTVAQQRQEVLEETFRNWIFKDPERRADLCNKYNRIFNSIRLREYNGEHIQLSGMNSEIKLLPHQRNAVARILYGKNSLLAHCVGAGKTYTMTAAAMESKRLGLCQKSMFVVPNHLTEQWGSDFLKLYPGSKVLVATKKDFQKNNRKKFCARIATGDYDAVIIGHSQFGKIPISVERQEAIIRNQVDDIVEAIKEAKESAGDKFSIKRMERARKNLELKIKKLYEKEQDDTVTFEELGIDRLFVDEAQEFKNLYMHTKMLNVSGITQSDAQKSNDLFAKCRYMDEITNGRGVTFATGTPISNSMVELYTMMRYLQNDTLESHNLKHFDNWAATFGEKVTALELKPEGTGFRAKTRFSRFYNLPELMNLWRESADIQTAEMLNLPVPKAEYITISTEASDAQKQIILKLADRAEIIRRRAIDPKEDNLLKITSEGRKLALDQRLINPLLPDEPGSKVNACVENVFNIWQDSTSTKGTQLIFCDMSTPKGKSGKTKAEKIDSDDKDNKEEFSLSMNVYADIKRKLISKGIPEKEIAFIHDADNEVQKEELFSKVRKGQIRVLLGST